MNYYENNMKLIGEAYPNLDYLIEKAKREIDDGVAIIEEHYNGDRVLIINKAGKNIYLNGKRETKKPAVEWAKDLRVFADSAPILMLGVGNTTYLEELLKKIDKKVIIFIYEPSITIFVDFLNNFNLKKLFDVAIPIFWIEGVTGMDDVGLEGVLKSIIKYELFDYSYRVLLPNYDTLFPEETYKFIKYCRDISQTELVRKNTASKFSSVLAKNILANMKYILDGYKTIQFAGIFPKEFPGILVAAGPSLNKNINQLKKAKNKAFIVATDTALKPLIKEGIIPDLVAIVDGKKPIHLVETEKFKEIPLLCSICSASEIMEYHTDKKIFYNEGYKLSDVILNHSHINVSQMPIGGSVATLGFAFMYMIGFSNIILVGQDLAYTNNRSHADGTFQEKMPEVSTTGVDFEIVEGNYVDEVVTSSDFKLYLEWYEYYINGIKGEKPDMRIINATEGGAKIKGTELMSLQEAIDEFCVEEVNVSSVLNSIPQMFSNEERSWAANYISELPNQCDQISKLAINAQKIYKQIDSICKRKNMDSNEYLSLVKKLDIIDKKIEKIDMYDMIKDTMSDAQYILKAEQYIEYDNIQEEGIEMARKGMLYMKNVAKCSKLFKEYCEDVNKNIRVC